MNSSDETNNEPSLQRASIKAMWLFSALFVVSVCLYGLSLVLGSRMAEGGHSASTQANEIVIGNDAFAIPAHMIRFADARRNGVAKRVDLYVYWPTKSGYSRDNAAAFNMTDPAKADIVFITFVGRDRIMDMRDRFGPVYSKATNPNGKPIHDGLIARELKPELGFVDETLVFDAASRGANRAHFAARCHSGDDQMLVAACETELFVGQTTEMRVRFPAHMLENWRVLQAELDAFARHLLLDG